LLLSGGYLTQKGASVLDCPSRTFPSDGKADPVILAETALGASAYAEEMTKLMNDATRWDPREPFYTTGGKVAWSNGNNIGDFNGAKGLEDTGWGLWGGGLHVNTVKSNPLDPGFAPDWLTNGHPFDTVTDRGCFEMSDVDQDHGNRCVIISSYTLRPDTNHRAHYDTFKIREIAGTAIASDAIWALWARGNWAEQGVDGGPHLAWRTMETLTKRSWMSNHDMSYNVLFTDGSVKSFSDAGLSLMKSCFIKRLADVTSLTPQDFGELYEEYFDGLYAQD